MMASWLYLFVAIVLEVIGTTCMKLSEGFTRLWPSIVVAVTYIVSLGLFTIAIKRIDVSVAYAIWSGLGTALISVIGFTYFKEALTPVRVGSICMIVAGVVGLQISPSDP